MKIRTSYLGGPLVLHFCTAEDEDKMRTTTMLTGEKATPAAGNGDADGGGDSAANDDGQAAGEGAGAAATPYAEIASILQVNGRDLRRGWWWWWGGRVWGVAGCVSTHGPCFPPTSPLGAAAAASSGAGSAAALWLWVLLFCSVLGMKVVSCWSRAGALGGSGLRRSGSYDVARLCVPAGDV